MENQGSGELIPALFYNMENEGIICCNCFLNKAIENKNPMLFIIKNNSRAYYSLVDNNSYDCDCCDCCDCNCNCNCSCSRYICNCCNRNVNEPGAKAASRVLTEMVETAIKNCNYN